MDQTAVWSRTRSELREVSITPSRVGMGTTGHGTGHRASYTAESPVEMGPEQK